MICEMRMAIVIAGAGLVCGALVFACVGDGPGAANAQSSLKVRAGGVRTAAARLP